MDSEDVLLPLVRNTVAGDSQAWQALVSAIAPRITAIARSHEGLRSRGLAGLPDDLAEITTAALERLARDGYKNLTRYLEQHGANPAAQSFDSWLYGAVDFTIREHLRKRYGRAPSGDAGSRARPRPSKREFGTQADRLDEAQFDRSFVHTLGATTRITVAEIFSYVDATFARDEALAMRLYYEQEQSLSEIASALGLAGEQDANKLIRRLNARLRYKFNGS